METAEIEKLYQEEETVKKYIDSIADKRVNQARTKWEEGIPAKIEGRVNELVTAKIAARDAQDAKRVEIENKFLSHGVTPEDGFKILGEYTDLDDDSLKEGVDGAIETYQKIRYSRNQTPKRSADKLEGLPSLKEASYEQILENLDHYNET